MKGVCIWMYKLDVGMTNSLSEFLCDELGEKVLKGISYIVVSKADSNRKKVEKLDNLRRSLSKNGVPDNKVFRRYELLNGYIYDMELDEAIDLTIAITSSMAEQGKLEQKYIGDFGIRNIAISRKVEDLQLLCRKCVEGVRKGKSEMDFVLFSRNRSPQVVITGKDAYTGAKIAIKYDSFALRHTDVEELNREYLKLHGLIVTKVIVHEIVPGSRGVLFTLKLAHADI